MLKIIKNRFKFDVIVKYVSMYRSDPVAILALPIGPLRPDVLRSVRSEEISNS